MRLKNASLVVTLKNAFPVQAVLVAYIHPVPRPGKSAQTQESHVGMGKVYELATPPSAGSRLAI
jgi:hypothetical protein